MRAILAPALLCCILDEGFYDPVCFPFAFWVLAAKDYADDVVHLTHADNKCDDKIEARFFAAEFGDLILEVGVGTRHLAMGEKKRWL
jgi:hypothetical protein